jgi:hypothetical protein
MPATPSTLLHEHDRLLAAARALEEMVAAPHPGTVDRLARLRWNFLREMLLHFSHVDGALQPLMEDRRALVGATAARSSHDLRATYDHFRRHVARWAGLPSAAEWSEYRQAVGLLMRRIRVRLAAQEQQIYPLLPAEPGGYRLAAAVEPVNYAAEAWKIRALVYAEPPAHAVQA